MARTSKRAEIRRRLRMLRTGLELSQIETAMKSNLSESRYWRIENGYDEATDDEQKAIAKTLRTQPESIFSDNSEAVAS